MPKHLNLTLNNVFHGGSKEPHGVKRPRSPGKTVPDAIREAARPVF